MSENSKWGSQDEAYMNTISVPTPNISLIVNLDPIGDTCVGISEHTSIREGLGGWVHVECIAI